MVTIIALLVSNLLTGFLVLYAVNMGLRWQTQLNRGQEPAPMTIPNPVKAVTEPIRTAKEAKQQAEMQDIVDEWLNGPKER